MSGFFGNSSRTKFEPFTPSANYQTRVLAAHAAGHFKPGEVHTVNCEHQPGCGYRSGRCTCWPYITAVNANTGEVLVIGSDGHILERQRRS